MVAAVKPPGKGGREKKRRGQAGLGAPPRTKRSRLRVKNQPLTVWWRAVIARTRAARAAIDASIRGVRLPDGPAVVFGKPRQRLTADEVEALLDGAGDIAAAARPSSKPWIRRG